MPGLDPEVAENLRKSVSVTSVCLDSMHFGFKLTLILSYSS